MEEKEDLKSIVALRLCKDEAILSLVLTFCFIINLYKEEELSSSMGLCLIFPLGLITFFTSYIDNVIEKLLKKSNYIKIGLFLYLICLLVLYSLKLLFSENLSGNVTTLLMAGVVIICIIAENLGYFTSTKMIEKITKKRKDK